MSKVRVLSFGMSVDGFSAGPNQDLNNPLGVGGPALLDWFRATRTFRRVHGLEGGEETGVDEEFAARGFRNIGSWILGRNMFGPVRGPWPDFNWKGWWGETPPYHTDVFVLTHHERPRLELNGTTFHFVADGIESALRKAVESANGKDVRIGGGVATVRQFLKAGLIDEIHLALVPTLLGTGENLLSGIDLSNLGYHCVDNVASQKVTHVVLRK